MGRHLKVESKLNPADFFTKLLDKTEFDAAYAKMAYIPVADKDGTEAAEEAADDSGSEGHA